MHCKITVSSCNEVDNAFAFEALDSGLISNQVKPKTTKHLQLSCLTFSNKKGKCKNFTVCVVWEDSMQLDSRT